MSNKKWVEENEKHVLYFISYYEEEAIADVSLDGDGDWIVNIKCTKFENDYLGSETLEEAKKDVEYLIQEHFESERDHYQHCLDMFKENI